MSTLKQQRDVVVACFLGWTLDAFDFFVMIFVLSDIAKEFGTGITSVTWAITLTLGLRAVGAFVFGRLADHFGRKPVLMLNILTFSVFELASGFAPSLTAFLLLRAGFGIAMGGEWGIGASLTMESVPARWRGAVSGLLQCGYPCGYLLAAMVYWAAYPYLGWRGMFIVGATPALLILYIRSKIDESPDWLQRRNKPAVSIFTVARQRWPLFLYAIVIMFAINTFSHSSQDLYPNAFLKVQHGLSSHQVSTIAIVYSIGAILGCLTAGTLSQRFGRRRTIVATALGSILIIPIWAFSSDPVWLAVGAFCMQFMVQGCFGVVPAHLNELSPPEVRGTFPGFTYQLGNLLAAGNATVQSMIADHMNHDYSYALAGGVGIGAVIVALLIGLGIEARDMKMGKEAGTEDGAPAKS
ncbi:MFS transporter [Telmatospirillum sp.]|uniref:MFS transporter n=1 Tax=Telmatospirillum sp. TaxID=2079197 RepID=UPI00283FFB47|nr:MFS transporter [Telmatospirillum sp.]MDR3437491.1 MFS transporter [Telmatospirillum sp.]